MNKDMSLQHCFITTAEGTTEVSNRKGWLGHSQYSGEVLYFTAIHPLGILSPSLYIGSETCPQDRQSTKWMTPLNTCECISHTHMYTYKIYSHKKLSS